MEKGSVSIFANRNIYKTLIALFCIIIAIIVAYVLFCVYVPSNNALRALSSVSMDVVCMLILFILIGSFSFGNYGKNRTTGLFGLLLLATVWAVFLDFLNWAFDGLLAFGEMTFLFTVGSLCMGSILACIFSIYIYVYMNEMHNLNKMRRSVHICAALNLISFVITFALAISKTAFNFVDGHYETGALYDVVTAIPVLTVLYLTAYSICNVKKIGIHDTLAVTGYIIFMVAGALVEAEYSIGTTYVAVTIADIFIFVMLQNEIIAREKRNVEKWIKKSNTDELTGFYNRHAYEEELDTLEIVGPASDFVYVSIDVNALKVVNDSLGHSAGDELLIGVAKCLEQCFGSYGKIYRIGGDEFVALIYADQHQMEAIEHELKQVMDSWSGDHSSSLTVSYGYVTMNEVGDMPVRQMAILADKRMYEAKTRYYKSTGTERRNV